MAKITKQMKKELLKSFKRMPDEQIVELFIYTLNKQADDMITDFKKGFSVEALKQKWTSD